MSLSLPPSSIHLTLHSSPLSLSIPCFLSLSLSLSHSPSPFFLSFPPCLCLSRSFSVSLFPDIEREGGVLSLYSVSISLRLLAGCCHGTQTHDITQRCVRVWRSEFLGRLSSDQRSVIRGQIRQQAKRQHLLHGEQRTRTHYACKHNQTPFVSVKIPI